MKGVSIIPKNYDLEYKEKIGWVEKHVQKKKRPRTRDL